MTPSDSTTQELIDAFHHSFDGINIAERRKSFNYYLNSLKVNTNGDQQKLSAVVDGIIPQHLWQNILKVDIILHFELFEHTLEILKSENKVFVSKVVKNVWFLKKLLESYTAQQFVDELFGFTSISSRLKIVNGLIKYSTDEVFGKQLFKAYEEKYGLRATKQLLPLCPIDVIKDMVMNKEIKLSTLTVRRIIGKDLQLAKHLLGTITSQNKNDVKYIARTNLTFLVEILKDCKIETTIQLGNSTTHRLIRNYRNYISENSRLLELQVFNLKRVYFDLKGEYEKLVFELIVGKGHGTCFGCSLVILNPLPKKKQVELYLNAFKAVANCNLEQQPGFIDKDFLLACEDLDERDRYAQLADSEDHMMGSLQWIWYMRSENSIRLYKERMCQRRGSCRMDRCSSDETDLVTICGLSNDTSALLNVLKDVTKRFTSRKDNIRRRTFFYVLLKEFNLHELSIEHWKYINELENLCEMNNDRFEQRTITIQEQIIFCLKNKLPIKRVLDRLYRRVSTIDYSYRSDVGVQKQFILESVAHWNDKTEDEDNPKLKAFLGLLNAMQSYNLQHKDDDIKIKTELPIKWMIERLEKAKEHSFPCIDALFVYCLLEDIQSVDRNRVIRLFFKINHSNSNILLHFLKSQPEVFSENMDSFLESNALLEICSSQKLRKYYKRLSYLDFNQEVVGYFKTCLHSEGNTQLKIKSLKVLSICMEEEEYLTLIKKYYPNEEHLETETDDCSELYQVRRAICESLLNLNTPSSALTALLQFCVDAFFKFCLISLHHLVFNTQECQLPHFIEELRTKGPSARKLAASLCLTVLDRKYSLQYLENCIEKEENPSVIAHVIKTTFSYFTKNLDKDFLEMFKFLTTKLDSNDANTFNFIAKAPGLPDIFVQEYVKFVWNTIEEFGRQDKKFEVVRHLREQDYMSLDDEFLERILTESFAKENTSTEIINIRNDVAVHCLIYCNSPEKLNFRLQLVFELLGKYKKANKDIASKTRECSGSLVDGFCYFALDKKTPTVELISEFKTYFSKFVDGSDVQFIDSLLKLDLLELHVQSLSDNYAIKFGKKIANYIDSFERQYGITLLMQHKHSIAYFIKERCDLLAGSFWYIDNLYLVIHHLYTTSDSLAVTILVTDLFVQLKRSEYNVHQSISPDTRKIYEWLVTELKGRQEPIVKELLGQYFKFGWWSKF